MKMSESDFAMLKGRIESFLESQPGAELTYAAAGHSHMRYRWDTLWATGGLQRADGSYWANGLEDAHIDTALRAIMGKAYSPRALLCLPALHPDAAYIPPRVNLPGL